MKKSSIIAIIIGVAIVVGAGVAFTYNSSSVSETMVSSEDSVDSQQQKHYSVTLSESADVNSP